MNRIVISLNPDWQFCRGDKWDEERAERVCLPHSVDITPAVSSGCRNYQGLCYYRKSLFVPDEYKGKKILFEFEGAMGESLLYINNRQVGAHYCGYTPFVVDVGEYLNYGTDNELEVRLDNSDNPDIPPGKPQSGLDFSYEGGLYRDARMTVTEPLYVTNPVLANEVAGGGVYVWYSDVSKESAVVHTRVHIKNEFDSAKSFSLNVSLLDQSGNCVGRFTENGALKADETAYYEGEITVNKPQLWSPETPNLYTLRCEILLENAVADRLDTQIGIRSFTFTINDGVIFNGESRRFNGANYHQTWPYIGNAVPQGLVKRDIMKLKELGFNNIRSHYPFSSLFTDICNKLGMTVIVSNPGWQFCRPGIFLERAEQNMRDIVRWQRNNPCVLIWEPILNESEMSYDTRLGLHNIVHEEYPYGSCYTASDYGVTDILYCDYDPNMLGEGLEKYGFIGQKTPEMLPRWVREYGDAPDNFNDQNSIWRCLRSWGDGAMTSVIDRMLDRYYPKDKNPVSKQYVDMYNNKRLCGYGVWPGIAHNRGYHINPCWGGHFDLFRMPKFSAYFMQTQLDRETAGDLLYLGTWWTESSPDDVMVFSNAEYVELYWNDELAAAQKPDDVPVKHPPFTFKDFRKNHRIRFASKLTAKAYVGGKFVAERTVTSPGIARRLKLEADSMGVDLIADGSDIIAIRCHMIDAKGNIVPQTCDVHPILFEVSGEGEIIGDSSVGANPICAEAGTATVLVRSTQKAGEIHIRARLLWEQHMPGAIKPDEIVITSR